MRIAAFSSFAMIVVACHAHPVPQGMEFRQPSPGVCFAPLSVACLGECPSYATVSDEIFGAKSPLAACTAKERARVRRRSCDGYRAIVTGGGYTSVTDWFDPSGRMVGESRFTDAGGQMLCNGESGVYGQIPICPKGHMVDDGAFCGDVRQPSWRNRSNGQIDAGPCACAPSDPLCGCLR